MEEVPCSLVIVYCSVVLFKNPVITTETRVLSHEGCSLQHLDVAIGHLIPLHLLNLHRSTEGKSAQTIRGPPPLSYIANISDTTTSQDLFVITVSLETIRTIMVTFFPHQRINISFTFIVPRLILFCKVQTVGSVAFKETRPLLF